MERKVVDPELVRELDARLPREITDIVLGYVVKKWKWIGPVYSYDLITLSCAYTRCAGDKEDNKFIYICKECGAPINSILHKMDMIDGKKTTILITSRLYHYRSSARCVRSSDQGNQELQEFWREGIVQMTIQEAGL